MMSWSKVGGIAGLLTVLGIFAFEIIAPSAIAGNRVSGTTDPSVILASYNHPALGPTYWASGTIPLFFLVFVYGIYLAMKESARSSGVTILLLAGAAIAVVEMPTALAEYALQWTLVWVAGAHAAASDAVTRVALENVGVAVFRFWDVLYNSLLYWLEGGYLFLFSVVMLKAGIFRRAIGWYGLLVAAYQFFNSAAIPFGVPDALTLPGNLLFAAWFVVVSISLLRMKS
jgi:hypothetical protein